MTREQARAEYLQALYKIHKHSAITPCDEYCDIGDAEALITYRTAQEESIK
jgi:hypothetical protein